MRKYYVFSSHTYVRLKIFKKNRFLFILLYILVTRLRIEKYTKRLFILKYILFLNY